MKKLEYFILDVAEISKAEIEAFLKQEEADMKKDKKDYKKNALFSHHFNCPDDQFAQIDQSSVTVIGAAPLPTMTANEAAYYRVLKKFLKKLLKITILFLY